MITKHDWKGRTCVTLSGEGNDYLTFKFDYEENHVGYSLGSCHQHPTKQQLIEFAKELLKCAKELKD